MARDKIGICADHGGKDLKRLVQDFLGLMEFEVVDYGVSDSTNSSVDYPDYGYKLAETIESGQAPFGIAICGTGIGISIAINRSKAVRAGLCVNTTMARLTRAHNDANVLALGERIIGTETAFDIVEVFLNTEFEGGRHSRRIEKMSQKGLNL